MRAPSPTDEVQVTLVRHDTQAASRRAVDAALAVACASHDAPPGQPCWTVVGSTEHPACCGARVHAGLHPAPSKPRPGRSGGRHRRPDQSAGRVVS